MSIDSAPLDGSPEVSAAAPTVVFAAPASWPRRLPPAPGRERTEQWLASAG
jgi:hypothetical protein